MENVSTIKSVRLTSYGLRLLAKIQMGATMSFTKAVIGDGYMQEGQDVAELTELINEIPSHQTGTDATSATVDLTKMMSGGDGTLTLSVRIKNGDRAFYMRELGIKAKDPDYGEIVFAYINFGDSASIMPVFDGSTYVVRNIKISFVISNSANVTANITLPAEVSCEEFEKHKATPVLDHPDGCVTYAKLNADVIDKFLEIENRFSKLKEVDKVKISFSVGSNGNNFNAVYHINFNGTQYPLTTRIIPKIASTDVVYKFYIKYDYETGTFNAMASHNNEEEDEQGTIFSKTFTDSCSCTESFLMIKNNDGYAERF